MSVPDLYKILGVEKEAAAEEIKKAYRRLARELHPDRNKAEDAEERFKTVTEAYKILSDETARKEYDEDFARGTTRTTYDFKYQDAFDMFFGSRRTAAQPIIGDDITVSVMFTAYEAATGANKERNIYRKRKCPDCDGKGVVSSPAKCMACGGAGKTVEKKPTPFGQIETAVTCSKCGGVGREGATPCYTCARNGLLPDDAKVMFQIPEYVYDGWTFRHQGQGEPGRDGGANGDLVVTFRHDPSDRFSIENGADLVTTTSLDLKTALVGGDITLYLPSGDPMVHTVLAGTMDGDRISVPDKGLYDAGQERRGNCVFVLRVFLPKLSAAGAKKIAVILDKEKANQA